MTDNWNLNFTRAGLFKPKNAKEIGTLKGDFIEAKKFGETKLKKDCNFDYQRQFSISAC